MIKLGNAAKYTLPGLALQSCCVGGALDLLSRKSSDLKEKSNTYPALD